jgi:hypothetical protein
MYMSTSSFKKVSAAAIAAVIGLSGMAHAAPITLPYVSHFNNSPTFYSNGDVYTNGALQGQAPGTGTGTTGWVNENGEANDTATVAGVATADGTVTLNAVANAGTPTAPIWSDVYNSNLADHPAGLYGPSNGNGVALNATTYGNNLTISYNLNVAAGGSLTNGTAAAGFGTRILDSSDNLLAALFVAPSLVVGEVNVYTQTGNTAAAVPVATLGGPPDGTAATYAIHLDLSHGDFQVFVNGVGSGDIPIDPSEVGVTSIGGIALSTDNLGTNSGTFADFSVVPEPASFAMAGIGGLMLLAKRRRRQA